MVIDVRIRLDPWEPDYDAAIQLTVEDEAQPDVDLQVESAVWSVIDPLTPTLPKHVHFVDGVRRIEHRILVESDDRTSFGLLGSFAVGATRIDGKASIVSPLVRRVAVVGGGVQLDAMTFGVQASTATVSFDALAVAENTPEAPLLGLQNVMREAEAALAASLGGDDCLTFLDGPLSFFTAHRLPVVGFVKRLLRSYLPPDKAILLRTLPVGQRTPIFLIKETRHQRYSWYSRIGYGRPIDSQLTGIVRLETLSSLNMQEVQRLANLSASLLPRYASALGHDPRAPQNLYPIAGLERYLRRLLGDTLVVRRAIELYLHTRELAA